MQATVRLGRIFGIPIGIHFSWLLVFALVTITLGYGIFPDWLGGSLVVAWLAALAASLLFFVSLIAHELGHALVARRYGIPVHSITLFALGGVAGLEREPERAGAEFWMALAGPAVSLALALLNGGLWYLTQHGPDAPNAVLFYLALANGMLVLFNLIPGYPLDGGRLLHAAIWGLTGNLRRATRAAALIGTLVGLGFIAFGLFELIFETIYSGIWLVAIGWFLQQLARDAYRSARPPRPSLPSFPAVERVRPRLPLAPPTIEQPEK
ncbi:MAG TPA: site-2 protease family protein [Nitrolancea sp.]|nr:site-2 protease family protein [Nitrolancea sp.]